MINYLEKFRLDGKNAGVTRKASPNAMCLLGDLI
jgi:hypothetical protein